MGEHAPVLDEGAEADEVLNTTTAVVETGGRLCDLDFDEQLERSAQQSGKPSHVDGHGDDAVQSTGPGDDIGQDPLSPSAIGADDEGPLRGWKGLRVLDGGKTLHDEHIDHNIVPIEVVDDAADVARAELDHALFSKNSA